MSRSRVLARVAEVLSRRCLPWWLAALAALLLAPSLGVGLVLDDYVIRAVETGRGRDLAGAMTPFDFFRFTGPGRGSVAAMMDQGALPWWSSPGLRLAFFRPLSSASHWIDCHLFPDTPVAMHLVSIAWVAGAVILASLLYRRLLGEGWPAGLAALFFALDPGHAIAGGWIASRNSVLAAFFGLAAVYAHDRWRRGGDRLAALVAPLACAASLASGESGAGTLCLLFAHVVAFEGPRLATRARALGPTVAVALLWATAYRGLGYGAAHSAMYADPMASPAAYLRVAAITIPINLGARLGGPPASIYVFVAERMLPVMAAVGAAFALAVAVVLAARNREPVVRFFALGALLAALPIAGTMANDRNLFLLGFACFGLLALVVQRAVERPGLRLFAAWIVVVNVGLALPSVPVNAATMLMFARLSRDPLSRVLLDDAVRAQTVVFVNPPTPFFVSQMSATRAGTTLPVPARLRALWPGIYPARVVRTRADQLAMHVEGGMLPRPGNWPAGAGESPALRFEYVAQHLESFVRGPGEPMRAGEVVTLTGLRVEVVAATAEGSPTDVTFTFDRALDDPSMRWLVWEGDGYAAFAVPEVGAEVDLAGARIAP
jgi:hypothetical protein